MSKEKRSKRDDNNSIVNVTKESGTGVRGIFTTVYEGLKDTVKTLKAGGKPNQKLTPGSIAIIVVAVLIMLYFVIDTFVGL